MAPSCNGKLLLELRLYEYMDPSEVTLPRGVRFASSAAKLPRGVRLLSGTKLFRGLRFTSGTRLPRGDRLLSGRSDPPGPPLLPPLSGTKLLRGLRLGLRSGIKLFRELRNAVTSATMLGLDDLLYCSGSGNRLLREPRLKILGSMLPRGLRLYASSGTKLLRGLFDTSGVRLLRDLRPIESLFWGSTRYEESSGVTLLRGERTGFEDFDCGYSLRLMAFSIRSDELFSGEYTGKVGALCSSTLVTVILLLRRLEG